MAEETSKTFRWANLAVGLLLLISAVIQLNDPDPWRWVLIYGLAAVACFLFPRGRRPWLPPVVVGLAAVSWAVRLAPEAVPGLRVQDLVRRMEDKTPAIELGREFLGLVIIAAWMAFLVIRAIRTPTGNPDS